MTASVASGTLDDDRLRIRVRGGVQGVGFRPFVYGLATRFGLSGFVLNDDDGVFISTTGIGAVPADLNLPATTPAPATA